MFQVSPNWPHVGPKIAPSWPMLVHVGPKLAPCWPIFQSVAKDCQGVHEGTGCQERVSRHESHIKNGHHESHIKHDHPLACDLWDCSNLVLLSSCLAMSFLSKRFIQTFPPGVPVDVSFLSLHLFRALHEGTLVMCMIEYIQQQQKQHRQQQLQQQFQQQL